MEKTIFKTDNELSTFIASLKKQNKKIVFTNGVFDIIHRGHVEYLNEAKSYGDILIVGLNSDTSTKSIKGSSRPINKEDDRAFVLTNLKAVDYIAIFEEDTPYNLIKIIVPDVLVKGGDWKPRDIVGSDIVLGSGGKVLSLKYVDNYSTTGIIKKISET